MTIVTDPAGPVGAGPHAVEPEAPDGRLSRWFGPLTASRVVAMLLAVAFLAGATGWAIGSREHDPLSATDVGFLRDMGFHHSQAVEMSTILLGKDDVDPGVQSFAHEFIRDQRYEQGIFDALLDRFGHSPEVGDTVMGWMGRPVPRDSMAGLATEAQVAELRAASGAEVEALFIALMSEHHLGGLHMADWEARKGSDRTVRNQAKAIVSNQRSEVVELSRYRTRHGLPIPDGFTDPMEDQRLRPLSLSED